MVMITPQHETPILNQDKLLKRLTAYFPSTSSG